MILNLKDDIKTFERGLRAKLPLYHDIMTEYGLTLMTNEEIEAIADKFNSIGCTSFMLTPEQIEKLLSKESEKWLDIG
jgi:hypothetical protein